MGTKPVDVDISAQAHGNAGSGPAERDAELEDADCHRHAHPAAAQAGEQAQDRRDTVYGLVFALLDQHFPIGSFLGVPFAKYRNFDSMTSERWSSVFISYEAGDLGEAPAPFAVVIEAPTATNFPPAARASVVVCGSHGGRYPAYLAARAGLRAVIFNDAGVGLEAAGIASLTLLGRGGMAAATVAHTSARIGDPADMLARGIISHANDPARVAGVAPGMPCRLAAERLSAAEVRSVEVPPSEETRTVLEPPGAERRLVLIDSAAMVEPADAGQIIVTGSHGGLVGGDPAYALRVEGSAAVFNDAGIGIEDAGLGRLPALEQRGIAAFTVAAASARIGEALSTYEDGIVSAANERARASGAVPGARAKEVLLAWARGATRGLSLAAEAARAAETEGRSGAI